MKANDIDQSELARLIGCSKGYISQLFNEKKDHKLTKLIELSLCIGLLPRISFAKIPSYSLNQSKTSFDFDVSGMNGC